jgi:hypothetical protein
MDMETLKRRLELIEKKRHPKQHFDLVALVKNTRLETERLMNLTQSDYEREISQNPSSTANSAAREAAAYEKQRQAIQAEANRLLNLPTAQFELEMNQPNHATDLNEWWTVNEARKQAQQAKLYPPTSETLKMEEEEHQKLTSENNWVSNMMKDRAKNAISPKNSTQTAQAQKLR